MQERQILLVRVTGSVHSLVHHCKIERRDEQIILGAHIASSSRYLTYAPFSSPKTSPKSVLPAERPSFQSLLENKNNPADANLVLTRVLSILRGRNPSHFCLFKTNLVQVTILCNDLCAPFKLTSRAHFLHIPCCGWVPDGSFSFCELLFFFPW